MSMEMPIKIQLVTSVDDAELRYVEMAVNLLNMCDRELGAPTMQRVLRYLNGRFFDE